MALTWCAARAQNVGIGTTTPAKKLDVQGLGGLRVSTTNEGSGIADWIAANLGATTGDRLVMGLLHGNATIGAHNNALNQWTKLYLAPVGGINIGSLAGTGNRMVMTDANGDLSTQAIPMGSGGTVTNVVAATTPGNPITVTDGATSPVLDMLSANASRNGYLSSIDWTIFNNKFTLPPLNNGSLLFSNGSTLAENNAKLFWDNTNLRLGIGTAAPTKPLDIRGPGGLKASSGNTGAGTVDWIAGDFGGTAGDRVVMGLLEGKATLGAHNNALAGWAKLHLAPSGGLNIGSLAGTGDRMVVADANGDLSAQPFPTGDNLGNHTAGQNLRLNGNWLSNDGAATGIRVANGGNVGINLASPQGVLDIPLTATSYNQTYTAVPEPGSWITGYGVPITFCNTCFGLEHRESWRRAFDGNTRTYSGLSINSMETTFTVGQDYSFTDVNPNPPGPKVIRRYRIVIGNHYNVGNISATYRLYGSNSGVGEHQPGVLLHSNTVTGQSIDLTHDLTNTTAYRYYYVSIRSSEFAYNVYQGVSDRPHITDLYFFEENINATQVSGAFTVKDNGNVGVGTNAPTANLDVVGPLRLRNGAVTGAVLTSDANGNATWVSPSTSIANAGSLTVSSPNTGTNTANWIAINAGNSATGTGTNTDRFVAGNVNGNVTIGGHNKDLNAWTDVVINGGSATVTVGGPANASPPIGNEASAGVPRRLTVNGSIRQGYYGVSTGDIPANGLVVITWNHNLGYNPVVMTSLDQTGGGSYMDFCTVVTNSINANQIQFIIRNRGNNNALGSLRWILVW